MTAFPGTTNPRQTPERRALDSARAERAAQAGRYIERFLLDCGAWNGRLTLTIRDGRVQFINEDRTRLPSDAFTD